MPKKKNREYKKGSPHRDSRKFVIVAEGKREDDYFSFFGNLSQRVVVEIVPREQGKSAAKFLLDRLKKYDNDYGIEPDDLVWFVLDVDRWPRSEIESLRQHCEQRKHWELSISNPCFEVWLFYHLLKTIPPNLNTAKKLKANLPNQIPGGYNRDRFALLIETAAQNAENADLHKDHYFPEKSVSKLYLLAKTLLRFLGRNWKTEFSGH